jgi:3-isopropylmalate/(R)-2-methylmalate dehydratase large subunit
MLKGKKVHRDVMMKIVPATQEVYGQLLEDGLISIFYEAGAIISNPGCGGCASGQIGMTGEGEVQVSTGNRNFAGKQGKGDTYLASPATAAATALKGEITVPEL